MESRWSHEDAAAFDGPIGGCVYCSRLIGSDPSLVLHGGGNSSVKASYVDITGRSLDSIYVKGSGWDMGSIDAAGFAALRLDRLRELLDLDVLSDADMARELNAARLDPAAPSPSVESLLHAFLPYAAVQHSHADAIINLTNVNHADRYVRTVYGDDVVVIPYVKPGFDLARLVRTAWTDQLHDGVTGMVLMNHGLFTFGDDDRTAYERHIDLIDRAERWLDENAPRFVVVGDRATPETEPLDPPNPVTLADLRRAISVAAGRPMIVHRDADDAIRRFVARPDLESIASSGPLTPDHVIRTKRIPMIGTNVDGYVEQYRSYVDANRDRADAELELVDPAPRIVLDPDLGLLSAGATWKDAAIGADIYLRTMPVIERSTDHLGGYKALPPGDVFDVEYWDLEQAKLRNRQASAEFAGQVAVVTGSNSGIGRACAVELARLGAVVIGIDISPDIASFDVGPGSLGIEADLTDGGAPAEIVRRIADHAGGVDIAVLSAGIFGPTQAIADFDAVTWKSVHDVNLVSAVALMAALHPLLARSPVGGRVVAIASKNVPAPGVGAAAYSTSKAALTQLVRVAALEWASDAIRVNGVHPDAVFDTGLWDGGLLEARAARHGLSVEEYRRRNLLGLEIRSSDVAAAVAALCSDRFRATTGALIPIDGGNERVI
jgi:rhamnose utilization protein RhaD (predicted bifunctional aldolase and dehydrogenase)/NAD(P)-dependent dehydrogenase (short-subunit alcohol dehydrogenase family)